MASSYFKLPGEVKKGPRQNATCIPPLLQEGPGEVKKGDRQNATCIPLLQEGPGEVKKGDRSKRMNESTKNYGNPTLAKGLRREMTTAEIILWQKLRKNTLGFKFRRQHPIGPYVLDFFCYKLRLCIELDGNVHLSSDANQRDEQRTAYLNDQGITVFRYSNDVVFHHIDGITESILNYAKNPIFLPGWHINEYL